MNLHQCYTPPIFGARIGQKYRCSICGNVFEFKLVHDILNATSKYVWESIGIFCNHNILKMECPVCSKPKLKFEKE